MADARLIAEQLKSYRLRKENDKIIKPKFTEKLYSIWMAISNVIANYLLPDVVNQTTQKPLYEKIEIDSDTTFEQKSLIETEQTFLKPKKTGIEWVILSFKIVLWCLLWKLFIILEFGAVFFLFSCFLFIWFNLYSGPVRRSGPSAYSVFNPGCEQILGTFTAEKLEKELLLRSIT